MNPARALWTVAEPFHALTYFAPESHAAFEEAGLRGFWRGYFAGRAAPLGAVEAGPVVATFFGFHPAFVARAVPSVWSLASPADAIAARLEGIERAAARIFDEFPAIDVAPIRRAVDGASPSGRALFAANAALPWPASPIASVWHACTLLREHRGDGHVSALTAAGLDACEAHVLRIADDGLPLDSIAPYRGWTDDDWAAATTRLRERGWLDEQGATTRAGHDARLQIEADTDRLALRVDEMIDELAPIARHLRDVGAIPFPNPVGVPAVTD